ncbi:hypothetical protein BH23BAC4_BH23BAC4_05770 [soil metagenome]
MKRLTLATLLILTSLAAFSETAAAQREWTIRHTSWSESHEEQFRDFVRTIGESRCSNIQECFRGPANPFRATDPPGMRYWADCADFAYLLRAYFAWKHDLPFSHISRLVPSRGSRGDMRQNNLGNQIAGRRDAIGVSDAPGFIGTMGQHVSTAVLRTNPEWDDPYLFSDHYSPAFDRESIRGGTLIYDPNGHVVVVFKVDDDGTIHYVDAHPDNSVTRGTFNATFERWRPELGAGFKNWRPIELVDARRNYDGTLSGGRIVAPRNGDLPGFDLTQYFGSETNPGRRWDRARFAVGGREIGYTEFVRRSMADGPLVLDPVAEVRRATRAMCHSARERVESVNAAVQAGIHRRTPPARLPRNLFSADGDWQSYSTPARDSRLRHGIANLRGQVNELVARRAEGDTLIASNGRDLVSTLLLTYEEEAACEIAYRATDGRVVRLTLADIVDRLDRLSFDPYHCPELRWGAEGAELSSCADGSDKRRWYAAQSDLRRVINRQLERTTNLTLDELEQVRFLIPRLPPTVPEELRSAMARQPIERMEYQLAEMPEQVTLSTTPLSPSPLLSAREIVVGD